MIEFKIGDKVLIKKRTGDSTSYPCIFTDTMVKQEGKIFTIKEIKELSSIYKEYKFYNGDDHYYLLAGSAWEWHSSMFEPVIEKEGTEYNLGDSIKVLKYSGEIGVHDCFFVNFDTPTTEHTDVCSKIREKCSDFCKIAKNMGAVKNIDNEKLFPEFLTIKQLVEFVNKINELYSQKPSGESTQVLTTQKTKEHEIRFQKPKASYIRGNVPTGRAICGRGNKTAVKLGHLSNKACYF